MADTQNDSWRTDNFRQSVRTKIEEAIRQAGNPTTKSVMEMENHVFQKAKTKEEYLQYVARVILHVRDINSKKAAQGMVPGQVGPPSVVPPGSQGNDPMSALRNLASQGGNGTLVAPMGHQQMGPLLVTGGTAGTITATSQPQQVQLSQAGLLPPGSTIIPSGVPQGMSSLMVQQPRFLSGVVTQMPNQQPQQRILSPNVQMQVQRLRQQGPQQMQPGPSPPTVQQQSPVGMQYQGPVPQGAQFQGQNSVGDSLHQLYLQFPIKPMVQGQVPTPNQSIASPVHQMVNMSGPQMSASPAGYGASPSPQIVPSPIPGYPPRSTMVGAPSPGSTLNTPGQPMNIASPMGRQLADDQAYLEKLKQLQKYIEPLRRMISRIDKDEDRKKEQSRLKGLLDILTDPNKRCPMETLLKCEQVLERLELKVRVSEGMGQTLKMQEQNIGQPLLDAIAAHIKSPLINHTLQRTFGPVIAALCGPSPRVPSPPPKRKRVEEDNSEISNVLQGEIARLDQRFKVQLDPAHHSGSRTVHLVCQLDDKNLPCVPPISITVPENYPDRPPKCNMNENEYESTPFLQTIKKLFTSHLNCMPDKFSVSLFLDIWEMSVRQACAPRYGILLDV